MKKDISKLVKKIITNKAGHRQTVWVKVDNEPKKVRKPVRKKTISNRGNVVIPKGLEEKYKNKPFTWKVMTKASSIIDKKTGENHIKLSQTDWKGLLKEHTGFFVSLAKRYNYGSMKGEQFADLKQTAIKGFIEGVNKYREVSNKNKELIDLKKVAYSYAVGRVKEFISKKLRHGIRMPSHLQKPFRDYQKISQQLKNKTGLTPSNEMIAKKLQKIWSIETFLPKTKSKEKLPLYGFTTTGGEAKKSILEKHSQNIADIKTKYSNYLSDLDIQYENSKSGEKDKKIEKTIIETLKKKMKRDEKSYNEAKKEYETVHIDYEKQIDDLKNKIQSSKGELKRNYETRYSDLIFEHNEEAFLGKAQKKLEETKQTFQNSKRDHQMAIDLYSDIDTQEYKKRKTSLKESEKYEIRKEQMRYEMSIGARTIPGIIQRIKEFQEYEAITEIPLNLTFTNFDERSNEEIVTTENDLTPEQIIEQQDLHQQSKARLLHYINTRLSPIHSDILKLHIGLHEFSTPTEDGLWGELSTNTEIMRYLKNKHKTILKSSGPSKFVNLISSITDPIELGKFITNIPFVKEKYMTNPSYLLFDIKKWLSDKPISGMKKVKKSKSQYLKERNAFIKAGEQSKIDWMKWRKANPGYTKAESTLIYNKLKEKYKYDRNNPPKKFEMKKVTVTKKMIQQWEKEIPNIFIDSDSRRLNYVRNRLVESKDIIRRITPIKVIRNLLSSHRALLESNAMQKSIDSKENFNDSLAVYIGIRDLLNGVFETGNYAFVSDDFLEN